MCTQSRIEELLSKNSLKEARVLLDTLLQEGEPDLRTHYLIALYHIRSLAYDLAIPHLMKVEESSSFPYYLPQVYKWLAYCFLMLKDYSRGEEILREFSQSFYSDIEVKNMLAFACYAQNKVDEAKELYRAVLLEDKGNITARNGVACLLIDYANDPKKALEVLGLESKLSHDPRILDTLGWAYLCMGEVKEAEVYLQKAFQIIPTHPEVNRHMALLMSQLSV